MAGAAKVDITPKESDLIGGNTVALFTQGASGDVNPKMAYSPPSYKAGRSQHRG